MGTHFFFFLHYFMNRRFSFNIHFINFNINFSLLGQEISPSHTRKDFTVSLGCMSIIDIPTFVTESIVK